MPRKRKDQNKATAKAVARITKTSLPKGEDLLGSEALKRKLSQAKQATLKDKR